MLRCSIWTGCSAGIGADSSLQHWGPGRSLPWSDGADPGIATAFASGRSAASAVTWVEANACPNSTWPDAGTAAGRDDSSCAWAEFSPGVFHHPLQSQVALLVVRSFVKKTRLASVTFF